MKNNNNNYKPYIKDEFKNKCFAKDLTISFGMGSYQKNKKIETIERYERVLKSKNYDEFNEFEKFQLKISVYSLIENNKLSFLYTSQEFKRIDNFKNNYQFKPNNFFSAIEVVKRDRTGLIRNEFLSSIIKNGPEAQYLKSHPSASNNKKKLYGGFDFEGLEEKKKGWITSFSKLKKSDGTAVYKMITTLNCFDFSKVTINKEIYFNYGGDDHDNDDGTTTIPYFKNEIKNSPFRSEMHDHVVEKETNLTKEIRSDARAGIEKWGKIEEFPFGCMVFPSFKEICFSVLREMFLISNKTVIDKLLTLPIPILQDFLNSCFKEDKPSGKEITFKLYNQLVKAQTEHQYLYFNLSELFPLDKMISSCFKRDSWFRYNYDHAIIQDIFYPPYSDKSAINVYQNYHLFKSAQIPESLKLNILFESTNNIGNNSFNGHYSIVEKSKFISNFNRATNDRFSDTSGIPKNCIFIGGIITFCLLDNGNGECKGFENSDIDICFYDCGQNKVKEFLEFYFPKHENDEGYYDYSVTQHGNHITISKHYPHRHIQLNLHTYISLEDVLMGVDIEASCFAFDGNNVWCLERAIYSMNYRINVASEYSYMVRGDRDYQKRLLKYTERGFSVFYQRTEKIDEISKSFSCGLFIASINQIGFSLLLSAITDYSIFYKLVNQKSSSTLPFGPKVNKRNFNKWVERNYSNLYDGYNQRSVVGFVENSLSGILDYFNSERDAINYTRSTKWDCQLNKSELESQNYQFNDDVPYWFDGDNGNDWAEIDVDLDQSSEGEN